MKTAHTPKRKLLLSIVLLLLAVCIAAGGTAAIYTSQVFQRSVVRNRDNEAVRFSSDKLYRVASGSPAQQYYFPMGQHQTTMKFQVCNFDQEKATLIHEKTIDYTITFQITDGSDGVNYAISDGTTTKMITNGGSTSLTGSLSGGKRSANSYTVSFDKADYNKVKVEVTVTPKDLDLTKNMVLNGILTPIEYTTTQGVTVNYYFTDSMRAGLTPENFAAYNLSVSVSGGETNVVITWDHTKLDIDPFFQEDRTVTENGNESSINVPMNAADETGAYLIPFYNHNSQKWKSWSDLPITVNQAGQTTP